MNLRELRQAGHWPTLVCAFLYFDVSFMVWVLLGALANSIVPELGLSASERGLLVAVPVLGGALLRPVLGFLTDRIGARRTGLCGLTLTLAPLVMGWLWVDGYAQLLLLGALLGVAGASFAAALPLAGRWYPPQYQGLVMGIAGAGNSGTALATFFGPRLAEAIGWRGVFGVAIVPVAIVLAIFALFAKDSPRQPAPQRWKDYLAALRQRDLWWFCFFYSVTFGGFVGLASFLNIFFHEEFGLSKAAAGGFATLCVVAGSFLRPLGGYLSDRFGGLRLLTALYLFVGTLMLGLAASPTLAAGTALMWLTMASLGMGNGAVFQLAPQRFSKDIGIATGLIGAAGGVGGFFLPTLLGAIEQLTDAFAGGFLIFALIAYGASVCLVCVAPGWERTFLGQGGLATNVAPPVVDAGLEFSPELGSSQAS